jgi:hypothetical protein
LLRSNGNAGESAGGSTVGAAAVGAAGAALGAAACFRAALFDGPSPTAGNDDSDSVVPVCTGGKEDASAERAGGATVTSSPASLVDHMYHDERAPLGPLKAKGFLATVRVSALLHARARVDLIVVLSVCECPQENDNVRPLHHPVAQRADS